MSQKANIQELAGALPPGPTQGPLPLDPTPFPREQHSLRFYASQKSSAFINSNVGSSAIALIALKRSKWAVKVDISGNTLNDPSVNGRAYVTIHHETSVKSPLGHFQIMLYLESTCPKL